MFNQIINYTVRGIIVAIGILILSGLVFPPNVDPSLKFIFGTIFVLFGSYRIALFYTQNKRYKFMENDDEEE